MPSPTAPVLDLAHPLAWRQAGAHQRAMLDSLQPNIVHDLPTDHFCALFLHFTDRDEARYLLRDLALAGRNAAMPSAWTLLHEYDTFRRRQIPPPAHLGIGITHSGYTFLGVPPGLVPRDLAFRRGARHPETLAVLGDPPVDEWDPPFRQVIHAVVMVGHGLDGPVTARRQRILAMLPDSVILLHEECGRSQGAGVDHFGADAAAAGPHVLSEDLTAGPAGPDPSAGRPSQVLVPDPAAPDPRVHHGSYLVFRKLEQDVRRYHEQGADAPAPALAEQWAGDPALAHRWVPYGERTHDPADRDVPAALRPSAGVGLLHLTYTSEVAAGYEAAHRRWADDPGSAARREATRLCGVEYFFCPSLAFLRSCAPY